MSLHEGIKFVLCRERHRFSWWKSPLPWCAHWPPEQRPLPGDLWRGAPTRPPTCWASGCPPWVPLAPSQPWSVARCIDRAGPAATCTEAAVPESSPHKPEATDSLVRLCCLYFFPYLNLSSNHLSKMAWPWKAVCPRNINHYRIILCPCFITSDFTQGKITPPYLGKSPLTLLLPLGNILVHSLVLHPRPKAKLYLPIPLVTSHLSANHVPWGRAELWGVTSAPCFLVFQNDCRWWLQPRN